MPSHLLTRLKNGLGFLVQDDLESLNLSIQTSDYSWDSKSWRISGLGGSIGIIRPSEMALKKMRRVAREIARDGTEMGSGILVQANPTQHCKHGGNLPHLITCTRVVEGSEMSCGFLNSTPLRLTDSLKQENTLPLMPHSHKSGSNVFQSCKQTPVLFLIWDSCSSQDFYLVVYIKTAAKNREYDVPWLFHFVVMRARVCGNLGLSCFLNVPTKRRRTVISQS